MRATVMGIALIFLGSGCGTGGGDTRLPTSDPAAGVYAGTIVDSEGRPVAGAIVSVDGIQGTAVTGADGSYLIEDPDLAAPAAATVATGAAASPVELPQDVEISVLAPGYEPAVARCSVKKGERTRLSVLQTPSKPQLTISSPTGARPFIIPADCADPKVRVEGYAKLTSAADFRLDAIIVLDTSGSTNRPAFDVDGDGGEESVLDVELEGARRFIAQLDPTLSRVAVISFHDSATVVSPFSNDLPGAIDALDIVDPPAHGTNYEAAFRLATELFLEIEAADEAEDVPSEADAETGLAPPLRAVVFLTDGIPTSHGVPRDMSDTNLTQSKADRWAAIDAAEELGDTTGAALFGFSIISAEDHNRRRTTLPHCIAVCGDGHYTNVNKPEHLFDSLCGKPLRSSLKVTLKNLTTGAPAIDAELYPDGFFSELVPVALLPASVVGVNPQVGVNEISATLRAFSGAARQTAAETVVVKLIAEPEFAMLTSPEQESIHAASQEVVEVENLERPTGGALGDNALKEFLQGEFEDAVELYGVETFRMLGPSEGGSGSIEVNFVFKEACYKSDFGYLFIDPADPPASAAEALAGVTEGQILFNSGDVGQSSCSLQSIEAGTARREVSVPEGGIVVFFILPNRTLAQYRAHPRKGPAPLFTLSSLNPGGFDQVLTFRSLAGRTEPGEDLTVVTPGPLAIFAFEDLTIAKRSDQDFSDVVFTVSSVQGRMDSLECE